MSICSNFSAESDISIKTDFSFESESNSDNENDYYNSFEYNPCIRKGKNKPKHKKQKKYEAKVQKMNLIRPKTDKILSNDINAIVNTKVILNELLELLKTKDTERWNDSHTYLYENIYHLNKIELYTNQYNSLQAAIQDELISKLYEDYYEDYYERQYIRYRYYKWY